MRDKVNKKRPFQNSFLSKEMVFSLLLGEYYLQIKSCQAVNLLDHPAFTEAETKFRKENWHGAV